MNYKERKEDTIITLKKGSHANEKKKPKQNNEHLNNATKHYVENLVMSYQYEYRCSEMVIRSYFIVTPFRL